MTARDTFRQEVLQNAESAIFIGQTSPLTGPVWTQWFIAGSKAGKNVLAFLCYFSVAETATAAETPATGTDLLDLGLDQLQVSSDPTQDPFTYLVDRKAVEEFERISFNLSGLSYPRSAAHTFAGAGTNTDTVSLLVPAGGPVAALRVHVPSITGVYAANVTATVTMTVDAIYGESDIIVVGKETNGSAVSGKQDLLNLNLLPADISPDYVDFVGIGAGANGLTTAQIYGPDRDLLVDLGTSAEITFLQSIYPDQNSAVPSYGAEILALKRKRPMKAVVTFGTSYTPAVLWVQFRAPEVAKTPEASPTPVPAAVNPAPPSSQNALLAAGMGAGPRRTAF